MWRWEIVYRYQLHREPKLLYDVNYLLGQSQPGLPCVAATTRQPLATTQKYSARCELSSGEAAMRSSGADSELRGGDGVCVCAPVEHGMCLGPVPTPASIHEGTGPFERESASDLRWSYLSRWWREAGGWPLQETAPPGACGKSSIPAGPGPCLRGNSAVQQAHKNRLSHQRLLSSISIIIPNANIDQRRR